MRSHHRQPLPLPIRQGQVPPDLPLSLVDYILDEAPYRQFTWHGPDTWCTACGDPVDALMTVFLVCRAHHPELLLCLRCGLGVAAHRGLFNFDTDVPPPIYASGPPFLPAENVPTIAQA